jgi:dienelactone hydrolase
LYFVWTSRKPIPRQRPSSAIYNHAMTTEAHSHDWITIFDEVRCELCGAQRGSRLGDEPCTVPYPEPPPQTQADLLWRLIFTDNPADIARLEAELEGTRAKAVDEMIERSCSGSGDQAHTGRAKGSEQRPPDRGRGAACFSMEIKKVPSPHKSKYQPHDPALDRRPAKLVHAILLGLLLLTGAGSAAAGPQAGPVGAPSGPYNWQPWWVPIVTPATDSHVFLLEAGVYRPPGDGPFPLVTINHGKPRGGNLVAQTMHPDYVRAAQWFVDRGFAVVVPMRRGYGSSQGDISDIAGKCDDRDYFTSARLTAAEMEGVITYMRRQVFVDPNHVVVVGHSWGGLGALGVAYDASPGVVGIINFDGGGGSFAPGQICSGKDRLIADVGRLGTGNHIPEIWLYAENDQYFAPPLAHAMYNAYRAKAQAPVTFIDLPSFDEDGHFTIMRGDPALWAAPVARFLAGLRPKH